MIGTGEKRSIRGLPLGLGAVFAALFALFTCPACAPCGSLNSAFESFVESHKGCEKDDDCILIGGSYNCNCSPSLGACSGNPVNKSARGEKLDAFKRMLASCHDQLSHTCDCGYAKEVYCASGRCYARNIEGCSIDGGEPGWQNDGFGGEPDGGTDDDPDGGEED
ncbi:MAG: hypothetical protein JRJ87_15795 [Deltaproteobacteria bacterium]|nr:hypothetical protein [Deltaproteobacteria bacterium]